MSKLQIVEHNNQRILTTNQLAEMYGVDHESIHRNFNRNKSKYQKGKHFYLLEGDELRAFKRDLSNCPVAENINKLYLWTEHGALLHAKSLGTDEAWAVYEELIDTYFRAKRMDLSQFDMPHNFPEALRALADSEEEKAKLAVENAELKPKAEFHNLVAASATSIPIAKLAALLKQAGYNTGEKRLFEQLRAEGYLNRNKSYYNKPSQYSLDLGLMEYQETPYAAQNGKTYLSFKPLITGKGQTYFMKKYAGGNRLELKA